MDRQIEKRVILSDGRTEEVWPLPFDRDSLFALLSRLFGDHWDQITWGPMIPGAAYELKCPCPPERIGLNDLGYFTAYWGPRGGHLHLCIDPAIGLPRATARVELVRRLDAEDLPISWSLRLWSGAGDPQITVYLPNPHLAADDWAADTPDWRKLALWEDLFPRLTGHPLDGRDRLGKGYPPRKDKPC